MDLPELSSAVDAALQETGEQPAAVYLFGSRARGTAHAASDVDLAVLYADPRAAARATTLGELHLELAAALEARLKTRVDLVVLDRAPLDLIRRVLRDGVVLCDRKHRARIAFEAQKQSEYLDFVPLLRRIRKAALA